MTEYLLLLKLNKEKLLETVDVVRRLPRSPTPGVNIDYTMNIFGTWHVAVWFNSNNSTQAIEFINKKISQIPGVIDAFPVATFPHKGQLDKES